MRRIVTATLCAALLGFGCYSGPAPFEAADGSVGDASTDAGADAACNRSSLPDTCPSIVPSYASSIATVIANKCVSCHYTGSTIAREDLSTYQGVKANSGTVLDQVFGCIMPPTTSVQLTDDEKAALLAWLVCGSPDN